MENINLVSELLTIIGALLVILIGLFGWIGNRVHNRLDAIATILAEIELDFKEDIAVLANRVTRVETQVELYDINSKPTRTRAKVVKG